MQRRLWFIITAAPLIVLTACSGGDKPSSSPTPTSSAAASTSEQASKVADLTSVKQGDHVSPTDVRRLHVAAMAQAHTLTVTSTTEAHAGKAARHDVTHVDCQQKTASQETDHHLVRVERDNTTWTDSRPARTVTLVKSWCEGNGTQPMGELTVLNADDRYVTLTAAKTPSEPSATQTLDKYERATGRLVERTRSRKGSGHDAKTLSHLTVSYGTPAPVPSVPSGWASAPNA